MTTPPFPIPGLVAVCGAPASGKSTYIQRHAKQGEPIWDWDIVRLSEYGTKRGELSPKQFERLHSLRSSWLDKLAREPKPRSWIIETYPQRAQKWTKDVRVLEEPIEVLIARLKARRQNGEITQQTYTRLLGVCVGFIQNPWGPPGRRGPAKNRRADDWVKQRRRRERIYNALTRGADKVCHYCGSGLKPLEVHHLKDRARHPELAWSMEFMVAACKDCHLQETKKQRARR